MMRAARAGHIKTIYFENLSRLARDCVLTLQTLRELVYTLKVRIVSIDEGIDSATSDQWELLAAVLGIQHEQYLKTLAKFVFRGQEGVVLDRLCVGDYCFGYGSEPIPGSETQRRGRNRNPKKRYIIDSEKAAWVKMIFDWFVREKRSLQWIARELNRMNAPKDHRATTKAWHPQLLRPLLENRKYIGYWPWGRKKNVRDASGRIRHEDRSPDETEKWLRHFPELQIIDDEIFGKAQERLQKLAEAYGRRRGRNGKLAGSTTDASRICPRHLLYGLIECAVCGRKWYVGGGMGRYLFCHGHRIGVCSCQTTLRRDLAEVLILNAICEQILNDEELLSAVVNAVATEWDRQQRELPSEQASVEKALADVERRITHLLDQCEQDRVSDLTNRLNDRRAERDALKKRLAELSETANRRQTRPSAEWIAAQIEDLRSLLHGTGPAAALALRNLVGGRILVREVRRPGRKRHYLQGEFIVHLRDVAGALGATMGPEDHQPSASGGKVIVIVFREPDDYEILADDVKADFDADMTFEEIGAKYGHSKQWASRAYAHWHKVRGLPVPDARALRARLNRRRPLDMVLQAKAMELWDQDYLINEIAEARGRRRDEIYAVVAAWHDERGLTMPDGRTRRREIRLKREQQRKDSKAG